MGAYDDVIIKDKKIRKEIINQLKYSKIADKEIFQTKDLSCCFQTIKIKDGEIKKALPKKIEIYTTVGNIWLSIELEIECNVKIKNVKVTEDIINKSPFECLCCKDKVYKENK